MLCHKRTEKAVKVFFDAILEQLPGLKFYMTAIGADGEKSLIHAACDSFPTAVLLSCLLHAKKNHKKQTGLIETDHADQFERCAQVLIEKRKHGSKKQVAFADYFETLQERAVQILCFKKCRFLSRDF